jgi:hypothetical protein
MTQTFKAFVMEMCTPAEQEPRSDEEDSSVDEGDEDNWDRLLARVFTSKDIGYINKVTEILSTQRSDMRPGALEKFKADSIGLIWRDFDNLELVRMLFLHLQNCCDERITFWLHRTASSKLIHWEGARQWSDFVAQREPPEVESKVGIRKVMGWAKERKRERFDLEVEVHNDLSMVVPQEIEHTRKRKDKLFKWKKHLSGVNQKDAQVQRVRRYLSDFEAGRCNKRLGNRKVLAVKAAARRKVND